MESIIQVNNLVKKFKELAAVDDIGFFGVERPMLGVNNCGRLFFFQGAVIIQKVVAAN